MTSTKSRENLNVMLDNTALERVKFTKFLGVLMDTHFYGFPILYCTKWHPKLLRFLGYKATGFFNS